MLGFPLRGTQRDPNAPDLQSQLEDLLDSVWACERNWQLDDLIDLRAGIRPIERLPDHGNWKEP